MTWPNKILHGSQKLWHLDFLYDQREQMEDPEAFDYIQPEQREKMLMGFVLPPFQRPLVWEEDRMIRFIESAVLGLHLGTWVHNNSLNEKWIKKDGKEYSPYTDRWLIDGQQRLTALDLFWGDKFPVFGSYWSELSENEQRRFLSNTPFSGFETQIHNEKELKELYNRMNFGGVAHTEYQRAI